MLVSCEYVPTCQSNNIQRGATHIESDVHRDSIRVVLVELGEPNISQFGSLLIEDWSEGFDLRRSKGWILWESLE